MPRITVRDIESVPGDGGCPGILRSAVVSGLTSRKSHDAKQRDIIITLSRIFACKRLHCSPIDSGLLRWLRIKFTGVMGTCISKETTRGKRLIFCVYAAASLSTPMMRQLIAASITETTSFALTMEHPASICEVHA